MSTSRWAGRDASCWGSITATIHNSRDLRVGVVSPGVTVFDHVQGAIGRDLHIDRLAKQRFGHKGFNVNYLASIIQ